jgi:hypothetical protein
MIIMKQNLLLFLVGILVFSISCQNQKSKKETDPKTESEEVAEDVVEIVPKLNSIATIKGVLQMSDVGYYPEIINEPTNALKYVGDRKIAANIGVYMGDMIYVLTTSGRSEAYANYGAIMELAKDFGMTDEFPRLILERYEKGNVAIDSVLIVLEDALSNSEKKLTENEKSEFYAFMLLGNYIEKLYLVSSIIQRPKRANVPEAAVAQLKRNLLLLMGRQSGPLEELLELLADYSDDASHVVVLDEIKELSNRYKEAAAKRETISQLEPAEIYKAKEIVAIHKQIEKVRKRIVQ